MTVPQNNHVVDLTNVMLLNQKTKQNKVILEESPTMIDKFFFGLDYNASNILNLGSNSKLWHDS